jgi:hypothetical protein
MATMRSTEELLAAAEERVRLSADLPNQISQLRGWAVNADQSIKVTTSVYGELVNLVITDQALALGQERIAAEVTHLAGQATKAALSQGVGELSRLLGDTGTAELARAVGLGDRLEPDAPVLPYVPGVDPNANSWTVIGEGRARRSARPARPARPADDDDALSVDFSIFRSDR